MRGHIGQKLLDTSMLRVLDDEYDIRLTPKTVKQLTSAVTQDSSAFLCRQREALTVIKAVLARHGKHTVFSPLAELAIIEPNIQDVQQSVRDHIIHALYTFLAGVYVLHHADRPTLPSLDVTLCWKLAGCTHDLGYPLEVARNIEHSYITKVDCAVRNVNMPSLVQSLKPFPERLELLCNGRDGVDLIQRCLDSWRLDFNVREYLHGLTREGRTDHGIIAALVVMKIIDALYQRHNPTRASRTVVRDSINFSEDVFRGTVVPACAALAIHNVPEAGGPTLGKINFRIAPIPFVLVLCDTFQEWDRYAKHRCMYGGTEFDLCVDSTSIDLVVPDMLHGQITRALSNRLEGMTVRVNEVEVVA